MKKNSPLSTRTFENFLAQERCDQLIAEAEKDRLVATLRESSPSDIPRTADRVLAGIVTAAVKHLITGAHRTLHWLRGLETWLGHTLHNLLFPRHQWH